MKLVRGTKIKVLICKFQNIIGKIGRINYVSVYSKNCFDIEINNEIYCYPVTISEFEVIIPDCPKYLKQL